MIRLKLVKGKINARPGGKLRLKARITNVGDGKSEPLPFFAKVPARAPMRFTVKRRLTVPALEPGQVRTVPLKLKVKAGARWPSVYPVFVFVRVNPESAGVPILRAKSLSVRVLRPRR